MSRRIGAGHAAAASAGRKTIRRSRWQFYDAHMTRCDMVEKSPN